MMNLPSQQKMIDMFYSSPDTIAVNLVNIRMIFNLLSNPNTFPQKYFSREHFNLVDEIIRKHQHAFGKNESLVEYHKYLDNMIDMFSADPDYIAIRKEVGKTQFEKSVLQELPGSLIDFGLDSYAFALYICQKYKQWAKDRREKQKQLDSSDEHAEIAEIAEAYLVIYGYVKLCKTYDELDSKNVNEQLNKLEPTPHVDEDIFF